MTSDLPRRRFLQLAAFGALSASASSLGAAPPNRIVRVQYPENLESNFHALDGLITPTDRFYVRSHFAVPKLDRGEWRLKVDGAVKRPLTLSLEDLQKLESRTAPLLLECAGNGRVFLVPTARGVNWQLGAVGCAEWTGVPLAAVLERAGVNRTAVEVVLEGADCGVVAEPPSPGAIAFARSLPLDKAMRQEVVLAWGMNGRDLPPAHGAPVRAVVGGWYGMASVKWLSRIHVVERPFHGFWQSLDYSYFERVDGAPSIVPISAGQVKSQIARPAAGEHVEAKKPYKIVGAAWAGENNVARIDVSVDGGKTWQPARPIGKPVPFCWQLWEHEWSSPMPGKATLLSRATDSKGRTQPMERNADFRTYMIHHVLPVDVDVR